MSPVTVTILCRLCHLCSPIKISQTSCILVWTRWYIFFLSSTFFQVFYRVDGCCQRRVKASDDTDSHIFQTQPKSHGYSFPSSMTWRKHFELSQSTNLHLHDLIIFLSALGQRSLQPSSVFLIIVNVSGICALKWLQFMYESIANIEKMLQLLFLPKYLKKQWV